MTFGFRNRLAVFMAVTLVLVQGLTAVTVYRVTRQALIGQSERQLNASTQLLWQQMDALSARAAESVKVLALDYPLRQAIASQSEQTIVSTLRNNGRRVGAVRVRWVGLDGIVKGDTADNQTLGKAFDSPDMLDTAVSEDKASAVKVSEGKAFLVILVPVLAPVPIGYLCAEIPLDDAKLDQLRRLSALPPEIVLVLREGNGWTVLARSVEQEEMVGQLLPSGGPPKLDKPILIDSGLRQDIVLAKALPSSGTPPLVVVVGLSLDDALQPYRGVILAATGLLLAGLVVALFGTGLIARSVARPIEWLAAVARRIAGGDYTPPTPLSGSDEIGQLSGALANMAVAIKEREEHIRFQARHDATTGLANRLSLTERIESDKAAEGALLMIGVPRLQEIVNTLGHDFRDRLMRHIGERLRDDTGPGGYVARVSDIGFAVWLPGERDALPIAHRLMAAVGEDFHEAGATVDIATSIGVALAPEHGGDARLLLQHADIALHDALIKLDDRIVLYDPSTDPHRSDRLSLMSDLRQAIETTGLALHCQPKIALGPDQVAGAEGLIRWTHPVRGFVRPDSFIQLAEETGNIRRLTHWVLEAGIARAADWRRRGMGVRMSVNLSVRDLADPALPERVASMLAANGLEPSAVVLEITESAIMGEPDAAIAVLKRMADQGIDLSIDDFGVGQSSFAYLRRLPVREIKIDQSFILKLASSPEDATIVRSIVELGHNLGYKVVAEGVEDKASFEFLREIGCDYAQGYFIAKPLSSEAFDQFLAAGAWPVRQYEMVS